MTDKKKERERGKASRRGRGSVVLSGLIGTRSVLSARCQSIIENARRLDERRRDRHRYIHLSIYTTLRDKTANFRKASVFLRDVHSSGLKWRIPLERRPEKDESTRARPSAVPRQPYRRRANQPVTRSYVPRGVHDEWVEKARLETEWQDAKLWIPPPPPPPNSTTAHERTLGRILFSPLSLIPPLPSPCHAVFLHSSIAYHHRNLLSLGQLAPILRRAIPPATRHGNWPRWSPAIYLNLPHRPSSTASSFVPFRRPLFPASFCNCNFPCFARRILIRTSSSRDINCASRIGVGETVDGINN